MTVALSGTALTLSDLHAGSHGARIELDPAGLERMDASRRILEREISAGGPVYGTTTGLGPRAIQALETSDADKFSMATLRGRAHAIGDPLPKAFVRAAMIARANTLLIGASGARPDLALHLRDMLNADLVPVVRETGSVGAADLIWGATCGLGIVGEGSITAADFAAHGLAPFEPAPREGLALASHSGFVAGIAGLAITRLMTVFEHVEAGAALSLEGFRANLSIMDADVTALHDVAQEQQAAARIHKNLGASELFQDGVARRLQDPLSFRNIVQVHGAVLAAFAQAEAAVLSELNSASDNPAVVLNTKKVLSNGSFLSIHLRLILDALAQAIRALASMIFARCSRLLAGRFTDLGDGLAVDGAGLGPLLKPVEALFAEIAQRAQPGVLHPSPSADGLEDQVSHAAIPAKSLHVIAEKLARLCAIEHIIAAQAADLRGARLSGAVKIAYDITRKHSAFAQNDRAMGEEIEALAKAILPNV